MNIIKRYMGFILVLAIALTSLNIVSYASETVEETVEETVVLPNERFTTAADVFVHLGVFEQTPDFTATLLREEFARIITKGTPFFHAV